MRVRAYEPGHVPGRRARRARGKRKGEEREKECHTGEKKVSDEEEGWRLEYQANGPCNSVPYDRALAGSRGPAARQISRKISLERQKRAAGNKILPDFSNLVHGITVVYCVNGAASF